MSLVLYCSLTVLVILSGLSVLYFQWHQSRWLKLLLGFSGAYLLGIAFLHLLPEVYESVQEAAGIYILIGFCAQLLLEAFSKGIEHGHIHGHQQDKPLFPWAILISLSIHAFLEGMPIHQHEHAVDGHYHANSLIFGIVLHKIPVAMMLVALLMQSGVRKGAVVGWLVFFSAMMPLGTLVNHSMAEYLDVDFNHYSSIILGIVLGVLLHVSTTILFESSENHRFNLLKFLTICLGIGLALIVT